MDYDDTSHNGLNIKDGIMKLHLLVFLRSAKAVTTAVSEKQKKKTLNHVQIFPRSLRTLGLERGNKNLSKELFIADLLYQTILKLSFF